jgi:hypothetical protein
MNKFIYLAVSVIAVLLVFTVNESNAKSSYGDDVDAFCLDSNPFRVTGTNDDCLLCHTANSKGDPTSATDAYLNGDLGSFCSSDSNCTSGPACIDGDGDGFYSDSGCGTAVDCNDAVKAINPGASEVCTDSIDNNCDGNIDAQDPACGTLNCTDDDGDGFSAEGGTCGTMDCNDGDNTIYPGAEDICNDGIDQDCSGKDRTKGKACKTGTTTGNEGKGKTCSDGIDNDQDGLYDCSDPDCGRNRSCR